MPRAQDKVLADDLTGAAEIAGVACRHGRRVLLFTGPAPVATGLLAVVDTDSRLLGRAAAARRVRRLARSIRGRLIFKKTDSVLRGPVRAELEALSSGFDRVLLVPANPGLGRTIRQGICRIDGRPLHRTGFARDPHHPRRSSEIRELLGPGRLPLHLLPPAAALPADGLSVGDASSAADLTRWAGQTGSDTLAAGGAEFFAALLRARGARPQPLATPRVPTGPVLVVSGSLAPAARRQALAARRAGWDVTADPAAAAAALARTGRAWCASALGARRDPPVVRRELARLVARLCARHALSHLVIEGGATAAAIARALAWRRFSVLGEWAHGIVALHPPAARRLVVTVKPGTYPWPATLRALLARPNDGPAVP